MFILKKNFIMPCTNNFMRRTCGSGSSNGSCFFGSSGTNAVNRWGDSCKKQVLDYVEFPKCCTHTLTYRTGRVHCVPFFNLSETLFNAVTNEVLDNETPAISGVNLLTLFPTDDATYTVGDATAVNANEVNVDSFVDINVPRDSDDGVVIDLNELSVFANSIYENQTSATRLDTVPGSGETAHGVTTGPTGTADFCSDNTGYDDLRLMHVPEVHIHNHSRHNVAVVDGYKGRNACETACNTTATTASRRATALFEGVCHQIGCKPREHLVLVYLPEVGQWRVKDTNARA